MKTPIFTGSCTAIVTPYRGLTIDYDKMAELIELQYKGGTSAIVVCGTTGESPTQPMDEHEALVDFVVKRSAGRMKIIAGVGSNDTISALQLSESAQKSGADGVLMVTPYYNKTSQKGLVEHFTYVADRIKIPMVLYNVPSRTGIGIAAETYKTLSKHPNINGVKEASGDFTLFAKSIAACGDDLNFWSGNDDNTVAMMSLGALGVISVASNIIPEAVARLCQYCLDWDFKAAAALNAKYADLFATLFIETNPIPIKTAMNLLGMDVGNLRLPLVEMASNTLETLKASLINAGLEIKL